MSKAVPEPVIRLIDAFSRLPGVGPKTASRLTYYLLRTPSEQAQSLADALVTLYKDNASTLTPDPIHSAFYDSHPPPATRIARLAALRRISGQAATAQ